MALFIILPLFDISRTSALESSPSLLFSAIFAMKLSLRLDKVRHWCNSRFVFVLFQFFAHPVINNLMTEKWHGELGEMKKYSWLSTERWIWAFLNIWCLFDCVFFPLLFIVFGGYQFVRKKTRNRKSKFEPIHFLFCGMKI